MKKKITALSMIMVLFANIILGTIPVFANENNESVPSVSTEKINIDENTSLIITTENYSGYNIVTAEDNYGNISIADSREDYVLENGKKIYVDVDSTETLSNENTGDKLPEWQKIRYNTTTIAFEQAIKDLLITTIAAKVKAVLGIAYTFASIVKAAYAKPDLSGTKEFYIKREVYGYTYQIGREEIHTYTLDARSRKILNTDTFSDSRLKAFLGY